MKKRVFLLLLLFLPPVSVTATTWNEPWHEKVIQLSDSFLKIKITRNDESEILASVVKHLAGTETGVTVMISGFSALDVRSMSANSELSLPFEVGEEYYVFLKKGDKPGAYQIATPTTGWAGIWEGKVQATYRHSYHKAIVPIEVYERTMQAIFNKSKGLKYDEAYVRKFIAEQLAKPLGKLGKTANPEEKELFFLQHVALESIYHIGTGAQLPDLIPFVNSDEHHTQISACRAVSRFNTPESKETLMKFVEGSGSGFAKVMCVWGLKRGNASSMIPRLETFLKTGKDENTGFGGDIMDPRIGTAFPDSVAAAIREILRGWKEPAKTGS